MASLCAIAARDRQLHRRRGQSQRHTQLDRQHDFRRNWLQHLSRHGEWRAVHHDRDECAGRAVRSQVTAGTTYYYTVTAVNPQGESAKSNEASAVIPATGVGTVKAVIPP